MRDLNPIFTCGIESPFCVNRSDGIKHTVNAKTGVHIIILFHVLQFYYDCTTSVLSFTELKMRKGGARD